MREELLRIRKLYIAAFDYYYKTKDYSLVEQADKKYYEALAKYVSSRQKTKSK